MKILIVAQDFPWPSHGGGLMRLARMVEAVATLGETDFFSLYDPYRTYDADHTLPVLPPWLDVQRLEIAAYPEIVSERWWRSWMLHRGTPWEIFMRSYDHSARECFEAFVADRYDFVWFSTAFTFAWMGRPQLGPTVVDLDNLEDVKARQRASLMGKERSTGGAKETARLKGRALLNRVNAHDWRVLQRSMARDVSRVTFCSEKDVQRSGISNAVVVPNTYQRPERSLGRREPGTPPVFLFQGSLHYGPNIDAVDWLIDEVAPHLWRKLPEAQIRLVGTTLPPVEQRHRPPAVVVTGRIPEIEPELARADVALVPLRIGSGTRLKVLESFAHRIPVVSTTVGADGLDVEDGVHLLLADRPEEFAEACRRLIEDRALARRLVEAAEALFLEKYEWSAAKQGMQQLVRDVATSNKDGIISGRKRVV